MIVLFGKKNVCDCCGLKLHVKPIQISDGGICGLCNTICTNSPMTTISKVKAAWDENAIRLQNFNPNMTETNLGCGYIFIDTANKMACISNQKKLGPHSIVFKFSELEAYRIEKLVKNNHQNQGWYHKGSSWWGRFWPCGGHCRCIHSKTRNCEKGGVPILYLDLNLSEVKTTVSISNPPFKATEFLNNIIDEQ